MASTISMRAVQFIDLLSNVSVLNALAVSLRAWNTATTSSTQKAVMPMEVPTPTLS